MRGLAEYGFNLSNQMKRRNANFPREILDGERRVARLEQQIACLAQATEPFMSQEHVVSVAA
jgi:hypothetical protein